MIGGWGEFASALALFLSSHGIPARPALKARIIAGIGRRAYLVVFNAVSILLLIWLIAAAARAPYVALWYQQEWHRWVVNLVMPFAIVLGVFGIGMPNPLSFGGSKRGFDPDHPGVAGIARHPLLWAFFMWASVHLLANGDLAHAILFGGFGAMAVLGMWAIDARNRHAIGRAEWRRLAYRTSAVPFAALLFGRWRPHRPPMLWRLLLALAIWPVLLWLHPMVIGVSPLP
ncbi:MAG: NnrU family protein [Paracoccaceae bacterium]|nr:NnrU family protein [Paracoccaceae bacterium]